MEGVACGGFLGLLTLLKVGLGYLEVIGEGCRGYLVVIFGLITEGPTGTIVWGYPECCSATTVLR